MLHLRLPFGAFELLAHLNQIFEIIEGENSAGFVYDEGWQEAEFKVDVGGEANLAAVVTRWPVFQDVELVLELNQI